MIYIVVIPVNHRDNDKILTGLKESEGNSFLSRVRRMSGESPELRMVPTNIKVTCDVTQHFLIP
jgi:hypothetical protein